MLTYLASEILAEIYLTAKISEIYRPADTKPLYDIKLIIHILFVQNIYRGK